MTDSIAGLGWLAIAAPLALAFACWLIFKGDAISNWMYYLRYPVAHLCDDASLLGIDLPVMAILTAPPPNDPNTLLGRHRYAAQLREQYAVRKLKQSERAALRTGKRLARKGITLAD